MNKHLNILLFGFVASAAVTGCKTMEAVNNDLEKMFKRPEATQQPAEPRPTYSTSSTSRTVEYYPPEVVREAQNHLNARGYNAGVADGLFGTRTRDAVSAYQADNGIAVTGKLDGKTLGTMGIDETAKDSPAPSATPAASQPEAPKTGSAEGGGGDAPTLAAEPVPQQVIKRMRVIEKTDVKASADPFSASVGTVRTGQTVEVLESMGGWYRVKYGTGEGFVFSDFLK